jgi:hypothetical protein
VSDEYRDMFDAAYAGMDIRGLAADLMRERDSLRDQLATMQARAESSEKERGDIEARIVALIDAAHTGHVEPPDNVSAEVARVVRSVRINVAMRERAEAERDNWHHVAKAWEATEEHTAEAIAAWLSTWEPDYYADAADNQSMTVDAVLVLAADRIKAGNWREKASAPPDDESRCAVCGWPLRDTIDEGCVRANCSQRPRPDRLYAPERAEREERWSK